MVIREQIDALHKDEHRAIRVGGTRVLLDIVMAEYNRGQSAESISESYPSLKLADIHAVIAYYLRHKEDVDHYLAVRECEADVLEKKIKQTQPDNPELRARIEAMRKSKASAHASSGRG